MFFKNLRFKVFRGFKRIFLGFYGLEFLKVFRVSWYFRFFMSFLVFWISKDF